MSTKLMTFDNLDIAILEPRGSLIGGNETDDIKQKAQDLIEQGNRKLIIDMGSVSYVNSSGIGALVSIHSLYEKAQGKVKLCSLGKSVQNVFVITKLTGVFDIAEDREEALKQFRS